MHWAIATNRQNSLWDKQHEQDKTHLTRPLIIIYKSVSFRLALLLMTKRDSNCLVIRKESMYQAYITDIGP